MMKAFVRRNGEALTKARAEYEAELAEAWERAATATAAAAAPLTPAETAGPAAASTFDLAYAAYLRYCEDKANPDLAVFSFGTYRSPRSLGLRSTGRMAEAWESKNRRRVCARRFADRFADVPTATGDGDGDSKSGGGGGGAAVAAVVALVVAPMLVGRAPHACDCDVAGVSSDAVDWVAFNEEAFEEEFARVDDMLLKGHGEGESWGTPRVLEGCGCAERAGSPASSCSNLVACPVVVRRVLKMPNLGCCNCEADAFRDGDLFDLFS